MTKAQGFMRRFLFGAFVVTATLGLLAMFFYAFGAEIYFERSENCIVQHEILKDAQSDCLWGYTFEEVSLEEIPKGFVDDRFMLHLNKEGSKIIALHFLQQNFVLSTFAQSHVLHVITDSNDKILWYIPSYM